jgi:hypothetical protein
MSTATRKPRREPRDAYGHLKAQLNVRVSDEAHIILAELQLRLGNLSKPETLEVLLREAARKHRIDPEKLRLKHPIGR